MRNSTAAQPPPTAAMYGTGAAYVAPASSAPAGVGYTYPAPSSSGGSAGYAKIPTYPAPPSAYSNPPPPQVSTQAAPIHDPTAPPSPLTKAAELVTRFREQGQTRRQTARRNRGLSALQTRQNHASIPSLPVLSRESSLPKTVQYSHSRNMKRNSNKRLCGAITKRTVRKVPLCNLPTDILSQIVSWLPINDAVRTSILSREWKYVWRGHTNLTFDSATMRKHYFKASLGNGFVNATEFISRVDTVLQQHSGVEIKHMEVKRMLHNKHANHVDRWINFAIASKTKELIIDLNGGFKLSLSRDISCGIHRDKGEPYNIPPQLFSADNGPYLQCLELTSVSLHLPADFKGFLNLKKLILVDVSIADEDVQCMLSRCNLLEFFEIAYCRMVTSIRMPKPLNQFKHLLVDKCPSLQVIELNCSPTVLEYTGTVVPLIFTDTGRLKNVLIKFTTCHAALDYMVTGFPSTLPSLETLTLHCAQRERIILPGKTFIFTHLRHLRLELVLLGNKKRHTDVLDYAYLLEVAPFMEKLELLMWLRCQHRPYCKEDGELRSHPPHHHTHLKSVYISGFFGHKDQVELALHILRSSIMLEKMKISPRVEIADCDESEKHFYERKQYVDGHRVATEFVCKADHRNVVDAVRVSFSWGPPLDYCRAIGVRGVSRPRGRLSRRHKGCRREHP